MSPDAIAAAARLLDVLNSLLARVRDASAGERSDAVATESVLLRHRDQLEPALRNGDGPALLRAANLLTTVSKGVGDSAWTASRPDIQETAWAVTRLAVEAAAMFRAEGVSLS